MKRYIIKFTSIISLGALLLTNGGCAKIGDFGDTNLSPNGVPEPILSALLTNVENAAGVNSLTNPPSNFCQYLSEATYPGISKYTGLNIEASGNYSGSMQDCQVIINRCSDPSLAAKSIQYGDLSSQIAIATLLKTYIVWTVTDRWGDVPYSDALGGAKNPLPKYDEQKDIYAAMLSDIGNAISQLNPAGVRVQGDIIYGGDVAKWRKFGNGLRMLIAMRMSKRYPNAGEFAATEFNKSLNSPYGYMATNADNFAIVYPGLPYPNPLNGLYISQDIAVALTFTDALNGMGDTRRASMASIANGCPYGLSGPAPIGTPYARAGNAVYGASSGTFVILNAASVLLAYAEAIERGWVPGKTTADAQVAYENGIATSFAQWGQTVPAGYLTGFADYNAGSGGGAIGGSTVAGSNTNTNTKIKRINLQQWFAFYPIGVQGWSNWRRTGIPDIKPTINAQNAGGQIPRRYTYGLTDFQYNKVQVDKAVAKIPGGADSQDARMWWDQ